eukprot:scaffold34837_cov84-Isochrysis_galbana.AAC.1
MPLPVAGAPIRAGGPLPADCFQRRPHQHERADARVRWRKLLRVCARLFDPPPPARVCLSCPPRALGRRAHPRRRFSPSSPQVMSSVLQCVELTSLETLGTSRTVSVSARSQPPMHGTNPGSRHGRWLRPSQ